MATTESEATLLEALAALAASEFRCSVLRLQQPGEIDADRNCVVVSQKSGRVLFWDGLLAAALRTPEEVIDYCMQRPAEMRAFGEG